MLFSKVKDSVAICTTNITNMKRKKPAKLINIPTNLRIGCAGLLCITATAGGEGHIVNYQLDQKVQD